MEEQVKQIYSEFDNKRRQYEAEQADLADLKALEEKVKNSKK